MVQWAGSEAALGSCGAVIYEGGALWGLCCGSVAGTEEERIIQTVDRT